jgi:sorbitol/mannitol transport system substrate-binding protein
MNDYGPDGYATNGFNENLSLFQQGLCGMWIDATVAASFVTNPNDSTVADSVGFALAPNNGVEKRSNWLWAWALAIPAGTQQADAACSSSSGRPRRTTSSSWPRTKAGPTCLRARGPRSTRTPDYAEVPFAQMTLDSINAADPTNPTVDPVPYVGIQFVAIPEFAGIATEVSQEFSEAYAGQQTVEEALENAQALTNDAMEAAGYR